MRVGDLVRYVSPNNRWHAEPYKNHLGIILREIPGTDQRKVIRWTNGEMQSLPARNLEVVVNAGR